MRCRVLPLLLLLLAAAAAQEEALAFWRTELVVVVTWYNRGLEALRHFPLEEMGAKVALYVKGWRKSCATDIPTFLQPHVLFCTHVENAEGRDTHTIAFFLHKHYNLLPRVTFFVQDDDAPRSEFEHLRGVRLADWVRAAEADPFGSSSTCLCNVEEELWESAEQYGGLYHPMRFMLEKILDRDVSAKRSLRWPGACSFALPATAARRAPRMFYAIAEQLLHGGGENNASLRLCAAVGDWKPCRGAGDVGHMFERLWWEALQG